MGEKTTLAGARCGGIGVGDGGLGWEGGTEGVAGVFGVFCADGGGDGGGVEGEWVSRVLARVERVGE